MQNGDALGPMAGILGVLLCPMAGILGVCTVDYSYHLGKVLEVWQSGIKEERVPPLLPRQATSTTS